MRIAVVGLGIMGRNHIRVLRELVEVDEVIGVDPERGSRTDMYRRYRLPVAATVADAIDMGIDAAVVATPSMTHLEVADELLAAGLPILVEKPMAATVEAAEALVAAVAAVPAGAVVAVGHVERFNPSVIALRERLPAVGRILAIATRRIGPYPVRVRDVGVCMDLLTHDLDAVRHVTGQELEGMRSVGGAYLGGQEDQVFVTGWLADGAAVSMEAGWLSPSKVREVRVIGERGTLVADTLLQELHLHENSLGSAEWEAMATFRGIGEGNVTKLAIAREEPLRAELRHFLGAVRGEHAVAVTVEDGLRAVQLAESLRPAR